MSLVNKLDNIYTNLNTAFEDANIALVEKGGSEVADISNIGNGIRNLEVGGNDEVISGIIDGSVTEIELNSITNIRPYAFCLHSGLKNVTISDSVILISEFAFYSCLNLTSVIIGDSVTTIGDSAFYGCDSLTSVTIGDSVTTIGKEAFYGCDSLTSVTIGDSVTTIGKEAFCNCNSLTNITIGDSVTTIDSYAFQNCRGLTSVTIGSGVTTIGGSAFQNCDSLENMYLHSIIPPTLNNTSSIPSTTQIHVPIGSGDAYRTATNWSSFADKIVEDIVVK